MWPCTCCTAHTPRGELPRCVTALMGSSRALHPFLTPLVQTMPDSANRVVDRMSAQQHDETRCCQLCLLFDACSLHSVARVSVVALFEYVVASLALEGTGLESALPEGGSTCEIICHSRIPLSIAPPAQGVQQRC